ncbi:unnamed protein product [Merluccius merluccius]
MDSAEDAPSASPMQEALARQGELLGRHEENFGAVRQSLGLFSDTVATLSAQMQEIQLALNRQLDPRPRGLCSLGSRAAVIDPCRIARRTHSGHRQRSSLSSPPRIPAGTTPQDPPLQREAGQSSAHSPGRADRGKLETDGRRDQLRGA